MPNLDTLQPCIGSPTPFTLILKTPLSPSTTPLPHSHYISAPPTTYTNLSYPTRPLEPSLNNHRFTTTPSPYTEPHTRDSQPHRDSTKHGINLTLLTTSLAATVHSKSKTMRKSPCVPAAKIQPFTLAANDTRHSHTHSGSVPLAATTSLTPSHLPGIISSPLIPL